MRAFYQAADIHVIGANRARWGMAFSFGAMLLIGAIFALPATTAHTGVPGRDVFLLMGSISASLLISNAVFWYVGGATRWFQLAAYVDAVVVMLGGLVLVFRSGKVANAHWVWFIGFLLIQTNLAWFHLHGVVAIAGTLGLGLAFWLGRGDAASAGEALAIGSTATVVYVLLSQASLRLKAAEWERTLLERELAAQRAAKARSQVARDLHDGLGAELTALLWKARELASSTTDSAMRAELTQLVEVVGDGIGELRDVVTGLRGPSLGWAEIVSLMRARLGRLCGDRVRLVLTDAVTLDPDLDGDARQHLARILLEATRNALRHAGASRITVRFEAPEPELLTVSVEDDGRGLSPEAAETSEGGLRNLREHAAALGGEIRFSALSPGTRIELRFPSSRPA